MRLRQIFFLIIIYTNYLYSQDSSKALSQNYLNIQTSADLAKGFNLGLIYFLTQHISVETNFGKDILDFVSLSDPDLRYSVGTNWHKALGSRVIISFYYTYAQFQNDSVTKQYFLSGSVGSLPIVKDGFDFFYKFGLMYRNETNNARVFGIVYPNLELGLKFNML